MNILRSTGMTMTSLLLITVAASATAQQYRKDYPETLSEPAAQASTGPAFQHYDTSGIQRNYQASHEPSVLVLLGRTLGASTSEWQADERDVTSNLQQSFQGGASSTSRQSGVRQSETRQPITANVTPGMEALGRGFERLFGRAGIRTLHYDTALRRAQQENELQGHLSREGDRRKNETDAVLSYAEMMLEITSLGSNQIAGVDVESFSARLTRIDTNQTIAQYTTRPGEAAIVNQRWRAGDNGYEEVTEVTLRYQELGQEIAYRLFSQAFAQPLHILSGSRRMQPDRPPASSSKRRPPRPDNGGQ